MSDQHRKTTGTGSLPRPRPTRSNDPRSLYVINLFSSLTPMPLEMPSTHGLEGLAVFRSRRVEDDGREHFRLHLGYFDSREDAEAALPRVQWHYPLAWIASAPRSGLGSLDDTNISDFRLIRSPALEAEEWQTRAKAVGVQKPLQHYVVQLNWTTRRLDSSEVPQLAIFQAYALYTVTVMRGGVRLYGIRLGFFTSAISARQVALYVRPEFPEVAVVPISEREFTRAREMIEQRAIRAVPPAQPNAVPATPPVEQAVPAPAEPEHSEPEMQVLVSEADRAAALAPESSPALETSIETDPPRFAESSAEVASQIGTSEDTEEVSDANGAPEQRPPQSDGHNSNGDLQFSTVNDPNVDADKHASSLAKLLHRLADRLG